jgi:hypothetical protein
VQPISTKNQLKSGITGSSIERTRPSDGPPDNKNNTKQENKPVLQECSTTTIARERACTTGVPRNAKQQTESPVSPPATPIRAREQARVLRKIHYYERENGPVLQECSATQHQSERENRPVLQQECSANMSTRERACATGVPRNIQHHHDGRQIAGTATTEPTTLPARERACSLFRSAPRQQKWRDSPASRIVDPHYSDKTTIARERA